MFGKKESRAIANRLSAIKNAPPVQFSQLRKEAKAKTPQIDRETERKSIYKFGIIITHQGDEMHCVVRDISEAGAKIVFEGSIGLPSQFRLVIDGYRAPTTVALAWQKDNEAGISFV